MRLSMAALSGLLLFTAVCPCQCSTRPIFDFETPNDLLKWSQEPPSYDSPRISTELSSHGESSLLVGGSFISERELRCNRELDFSRYESFLFDIYVPDRAPRFSIVFFAIDSELNWYQTLVKNTGTPGGWSTVTINLSNETGKWRSFNHHRPWIDSVKKKISSFGLKICPEEISYHGRIYIDNLRGVVKEEKTATDRIYDFRVNSETTRQYEKFEIAFALGPDPADPFDPGCIDVICNIETPSGRRLQLPAFYFQNYKQRLVGRNEELLPVGGPFWKVRFSPSESGTYRYYLTIRDGSRSSAYKLSARLRRIRRSPNGRYMLGTYALTKSLCGNSNTLATVSRIRWILGYPVETDEFRTGARSFKCIPSDERGPVRISEKDGRCFEFMNGDFFWPIGANLCAAYDVRNAETLGVLVNRYEGTKAFERYLRGMGASSTTFARIWMSCWSLAIEWSDKYHHEFGSLGDYSMKNAWRLDRVMQMAEDNGVYVQLTLDTFGHFRKHTNRKQPDPHQDWTGNAYNFMAGGILSHPWYFFIDEAAFDYYAKRLRYITSRWGYSPYLLGWEICNEIDLITYPQNDFGLSRGEFDQRLVEWHRKTANLLHEADVHGHPVTTNYASYVKDYNVLRLRELDYLTSNRYVQDLPMAMAWIHQDRIFMVEKQAGVARPHFLLESGSDFRGGSIESEENYLHLSLWASWMLPYSASGMSWWWVLIDQEDFYTHFAAFNRFIEGEDRRGHEWTYRQVPEFLKSSAGHGLGRPGDKPLWGDFKPLPDTVVFADPDDAAAKHLEVIYLHDDTTAYVWVYDREAYGIDTSRIAAKRNEGTGIQLLSLLPGRYSVEIWNTRLGEVESTEQITKDDTPLIISLPPFEKDIAVKIKPAPDEEDDEYLDD